MKRKSAGRTRKPRVDAPDNTRDNNEAPYGQDVQPPCPIHGETGPCNDFCERIDARTHARIAVHVAEVFARHAKRYGGRTSAIADEIARDMADALAELDSDFDRVRFLKVAAEEN